MAPGRYNDDHEFLSNADQVWISGPMSPYSRGARQRCNRDPEGELKPHPWTQLDLDEDAHAVQEHRRRITPTLRPVLDTASETELADSGETIHLATGETDPIHGRVRGLLCEDDT